MLGSAFVKRSPTVSTDEFIPLIVTNALSPMRVVEILQDLVLPIGTIGIMSSGRGSITNGEDGNHEVYRASKSALNMLMRSFSARHADDPRTLLLMAPGLGADRSRRPTSASEHRGEHTESREYDGRAGRKSGPPISGLPRPEGSVVSTNVRILLLLLH